MTDRQAKAFCWATELAMTQQPVTLSVTEAREVSAKMQRLHAENTTLQQGYAAARLEIESLQARIKTMAEEHADELMVAHLDGRSQAAQQPAPSAVVALSDDLRDRLVAISGAIADQDDRAAQAMLREILAAPQTSPTPQADSQPAPDEIINMAREQGLPETEIEGVFRVNADDLCRVAAAILAARAPADSVTAPASGANWQDISTAPKDGTRFVAVGQNYGLDSEAQHTCMAQWFRGCWIEVSEWNEISELKYLTHWMPLPPVPGSAARAPADSVLEDAAPTWRCQHCIDRHDGIYGSWAAPCPYHDDDGKPRIDAARAAQEDKSHDK